MTDNYVDISFTVKASERNGRRLLRDLTTGQIFYEERRTKPRDIVIERVVEPDPVVVPPLSKSQVKRRKSQEGDK